MAATTGQSGYEEGTAFEEYENCEKCMDVHTDTYYSKAKENIDQLRRRAETIGEMAMSGRTLQDEVIKANVVKLRVKTAILCHKRALEALEKQLMTRIENLKQKNIDRLNRWNKQKDDILHSVEQFNRVSQRRMKNACGRHISSEDISVIDAKCIQFKEMLAELTNNIPQMTEYNFLPTQKLGQPDVGQIFVKAPERHVSVEDYRTAKFKCMTGNMGSGAEDFLRPLNVACSGDMVFIADELNHRIKIYDNDLNLNFMFGKEGADDKGFSNPTGVAVGQEGEVFVCDSGNHRIKVYTKYGELLRIFGKLGSGDNELNGPQDIGVNEEGLVFICDKYNFRVQVVQPDGTYVRTVGSKGTGPGRFENILFFLALTRDGKVLVAEKGKKRLHMFSTSGEYRGMIPKGLPDNFGKFLLSGVAEDPQGNIIASDMTGGRLVVMDKQGNFVCTISSKGSQPGQLLRPTGVSLTQDGNIVVCDHGNHRIQMFEL